MLEKIKGPLKSIQDINMEDQNNTNFVISHMFYSKRYLKVHMTTYEGSNC